MEYPFIPTPVRFRVNDCWEIAFRLKAAEKVHERTGKWGAKFHWRISAAD
jgi:hypothetical protein